MLVDVIVGVMNFLQLEAITSRLEAIAVRLEAIASSLQSLSVPTSHNKRTWWGWQCQSKTCFGVQHQEPINTPILPRRLPRRFRCLGNVVASPRQLVLRRWNSCFSELLQQIQLDLDLWGLGQWVWTVSFRQFIVFSKMRVGRAGFHIPYRSLLFKRLNDWATDCQHNLREDNLIS